MKRFSAWWWAGCFAVMPVWADYARLHEEAALQGHTVIEGRAGWLFLAAECRHLAAGPFWGASAERASRATRADARDPLPAILAFQQALAARGVHLVVAPVPPKSVVAHDRLPGVAAAETRTDPHLQAFYTLLREEGVDVLDLTDVFLAENEDERGPLYCRQDTHWSGVGVVKASAQIADHVTTLLPGIKGTQAFATEWRDVEISGDLWRMQDEPERAKETVTLRVVDDADPDTASPVLLLGDSHTLVFHAGGDMHYQGAGLPEQLAVELGGPVDLIGVRGSGATPARINLYRRAQRDPNYWTGKQVVIWVFAAREFTESDGWRIVPIAP